MSMVVCKAVRPVMSVKVTLPIPDVTLLQATFNVPFAGLGKMPIEVLVALIGVTLETIGVIVSESVFCEKCAAAIDGAPEVSVMAGYGVVT